MKPENFKRLTIGAVFVAVGLMSASVDASAASQEPTDSLRAVAADSVPSFMIPAGEPEAPSFIGNPVVMSQYLLGLPEGGFVRRYAEFPTFTAQLKQPYAGGDVGFYGTGGIMSMPGMMAVETGRLNLSRQLGAARLTLWGEASKYGVFRGLQTQYGFGGIVDFRLSARLSLTAYGSYYTNVHAVTPGMAGFMNSSRIGGYVSYDISDRWGVSVGAETTRSIVTNNWQTRPIVMPYYKVNKDVKIGVDIGGILYEVAKSYIDSRDARRRGPGVIGPMRAGGPPPVAPRR